MVWFFVGNLLHGLAQCNDLAKKNQTTILKEVSGRAVPLLIRAFFSMAIFLAFLEGQLEDVVTALHIPLPQWASGLLDLNVNNGSLAALAGYAFDSALGYLPFLQKIGLPPAIDQPPPPVPPPAPTPPAKEGKP